MAKELTNYQRTLRYALCVDVEIFQEEHNDATPQSFWKSFLADKEWSGLYGVSADCHIYEKTGEDIKKVLDEEIFPRCFKA